MNITLLQKRFLIIWVLFHSFALFVNLAKIKGEISTTQTFIGYKYKSLFTNSTFNERFWPFTVYNSYLRRVEEVSKSDSLEAQRVYGLPIKRTVEYIDHYYNGVFNSYDITEYLFYIILGLGFIFIPKLWK